MLNVAEIPITMIHTHAAAPGSHCFLVENRLIAGDTLFLQGYGRTDFPGGEPKQLCRSLSDKLMQVPDDAVLCPGHAYDPRPHASMGDTHLSHPAFRQKTEGEWLATFAQCVAGCALALAQVEHLAGGPCRAGGAEATAARAVRDVEEAQLERDV